MPLLAQEPRGMIMGNVTDAEQSILPGAQVELQPGGQSVVSNAQGQFTSFGTKEQESSQSIPTLRRRAWSRCGMCYPYRSTIPH